MTASQGVVAIIPARGGSKSIPKKNMTKLGGRPLISYVIATAKACRQIDRVICSTDDEQISQYCRSRGIEVAARPDILATDTAKIRDVLKNLIEAQIAQKNPLPDVLVLMQPTSPFIRRSDVARCVSLLRGNLALNSSQTVTPVPHNQHAFNQRKISHGFVEFQFRKEREEGYNKQTKPKLFQFGNVVAVRTEVVQNGGDVFERPSGAIEIERPYAFDLDDSEDIAWGNFCVESSGAQLESLTKTD
jgi:CMP-N,N'-diacetyllegionaminic acid synthase